MQVKDGVIESVPDRNRLMRSQTPQAFRVEVIAKAYENALKDADFTTTDDCGVVLRYLPDVPVFIVPGEERNLKLTTPQDLPMIRTLLK